MLSTRFCPMYVMFPLHGQTFLLQILINILDLPLSHNIRKLYKSSHNSNLRYASASLCINLWHCQCTIFIWSSSTFSADVHIWTVYYVPEVGFGVTGMGYARSLTFTCMGEKGLAPEVQATEVKRWKESQSYVLLNSLKSFPENANIAALRGIRRWTPVKLESSTSPHVRGEGQR